MATIRVSSKQIKDIKLEDKKSWPVDLQVWVEISVHRHKAEGEANAPFYLKPEQLTAFKKIIAAAVKKIQEEREAKHQAKLKKECGRARYCYSSNNA
jgi:hypothetical protein